MIASHGSPVATSRPTTKPFSTSSCAARMRRGVMAAHDELLHNLRCPRAAGLEHAAAHPLPPPPTHTRAHLQLDDRLLRVVPRVLGQHLREGRKQWRGACAAGGGTCAPQRQGSACRRAPSAYLGHPQQRLREHLHAQLGPPLHGLLGHGPQMVRGSDLKRARACEEGGCRHARAPPARTRQGTACAACVQQQPPARAGLLPAPPLLRTKAPPSPPPAAPAAPPPAPHPAARSRRPACSSPRAAHPAPRP